MTSYSTSTAVNAQANIQPLEEDDWSLLQYTTTDPASFDLLYDRYAARVYRYLIYRVGSHKDAEDLTSQVFLDLLKEAGKPHKAAPFAAWLFTVARRHAADFFRHRKKISSLDEMEEVLSAGDDLLAQLIWTENLDRLARIVSRLKEEEQELLRLRFTAELSFAEIACLLHRQEEAVKKSLYRLLARLERQMEPDHD